ncbi:ADPR responsive transcriptional repressor NtrR [Aquirhabdus parva]|uniref:NUDIX domain-containing protein n=1 Tax=Aquirhabdus parva TaxID=2283318 RepID=A0A345PA44_9GAMM|nr:NUDIX domain-containing protein [Aquirhabdus parva]AXI04153.1 NUDIX domain-containing protein [Aquirhabdus parva]
MSMSEKEFLQNYNARDYDAPLMSVDMAIFSVLAGRLQVLLIQRANFPRKGEWALPGGFINLVSDQTLLATAHRKLFEKTGIASPYLEQVATIGNATRDPRGWSVTALYFALIDFKAFQQQESQLLEHCEWIDVEKARVMPLAFDHHELLEAAIERLINKTRYTALPVSLLPALFTLTELQHIYEIILGQSLDKKAFRRRMIEAGAVIETGQSKVVGKRPAQLYRFNAASFDFTFPRSLELPKTQNENVSP